MSEQLNEVFDSDSDKNYPVVNLNLKSKVPQIWSIKAPGNENLVARMVSYQSEGDAVKQVKMGDKYAHLILMSLSAKGAPAELKGGLGSNPIGAINTIFDTVYEQVKALRMDAVMFRFPTKKMKGQGPVLQRLIARLCMARTGGKFKVLDALYNFTGKHTYILIYRKNKPLEDISGIPGINTEMYTKVDSAVGDVWVSKKDGVQVTKDEAIAGSIAEVEKTRTDIAVIRRTKISRRQVAASQSMETERFEGELFQKYEDSAAEFSRPATAELIPESTELELAVTSKAKKNQAASISAAGIGNRLYERKILTIDQAEKLEEQLKESIIRKMGDAPLTSVKSMEAYVATAIDLVDELKPKYVASISKNISDYNDPEVKAELIENQWKVFKSKFIKDSLKGWAGITASDLWAITQNRTPKQYTRAEVRGIREYVGSGYSDINDMLLGRYSSDRINILDETEVKTAIDNLDSAFKRGDRIPENITLWRSQSIRAPIFEALVKNKVFYFRNFVSTSLYPIIFGGWKGNAAIGLAPEETRQELNIPGTSDENVVIPDNNDNLIDVKVTVGWAIDGAHKINVVYPGDLSHQSQEMEVILPRGTMVQINKVTNASYNDGIDYSNQKFIQAEIMTSDQIEESMVVYDGDVLVESGELVPMGAGTIVTVDGEDTDISASTFLTTKRNILSILASCIDIEDTPEKFVQG